MIKVFHAPRSRSLRVLWMAEEMGLAYEVLPGSLFAPSDDFLAANPTRTLPAMVDGETVLTESIAILQYLGAKYGPTPLVIGADSPAFPAYLQFLSYGEATLACNLTPLIRTRFMAPDDQKDNWTVKNCADTFVRRLVLVEQQLAKGPYLAGEDFTAADISVGYALGFGEGLGLAEQFPAAVAEYWERLKARPAFQRASAVQ